MTFKEMAFNFVSMHFQLHTEISLREYGLEGELWFATDIENTHILKTKLRFLYLNQYLEYDCIQWPKSIFYYDWLR